MIVQKSCLWNLLIGVSETYIMDVAVLWCTSHVLGLRGISKIDEHQTSFAWSSTWSCSSCDGIALLFVDDNSVTGSFGQPVYMTGKTISGSNYISECYWAGWVDSEKLLHIKDLDSVTT